MQNSCPEREAHTLESCFENLPVDKKIRILKKLSKGRSVKFKNEHKEGANLLACSHKIKIAKGISARYNEVSKYLELCSLDELNTILIDLRCDLVTYKSLEKFKSIFSLVASFLAVISSAIVSYHTANMTSDNDIVAINSTYSLAYSIFAVGFLILFIILLYQFCHSVSSGGIKSRTYLVELTEHAICKIKEKNNISATTANNTTAPQNPKGKGYKIAIHFSCWNK